ncbi:hypothetical protein E2C01_087147 [Portunus trituberculatus]|uniref:Uncharacterized protein n=1 Tax=Portunus trituberculatus TaxID=210409 RepID=A0A5B7JBM1_PORTR|nr:hypothetical protein [Portunus trituberculatus]
MKPTKSGYCLNGRSECLQKYKDSTIGAYIRRHLTNCSLVNNGFSEKDTHRLTKKILNSWYYNKKEIEIFYNSAFPTAYKEDERILRQIVKKSVKPSDPNTSLKLTIYYKMKKTKHLLKNSLSKEKEPTEVASHL